MLLYIINLGFAKFSAALFVVKYMLYQATMYKPLFFCNMALSSTWMGISVLVLMFRCGFIRSEDTFGNDCVSRIYSKRWSAVLTDTFQVREWAGILAGDAISDFMIISHASLAVWQLQMKTRLKMKALSGLFLRFL